MIISRDRLQCDQYYMYACIIFQNAGTYEYSNFFMKEQHQRVCVSGVLLLFYTRAGSRVGGARSPRPVSEQQSALYVR